MMPESPVHVCANCAVPHIDNCSECWGFGMYEAGGPVMLAGCNPDDGIHALASLPHRLPEADYRLDLRGVSLDPDQLALGWALGAYRYSRYRKSSRKAARLVLDDAVRDLILDCRRALMDD